MIGLSEQLLNDEWTFVVPKFETKYMIHNFDDGNEKYEMYDNNWIIFGEWKGKVSVFNHEEPSIILKSISRWKLINTYSSSEFDEDPDEDFGIGCNKCYSCVTGGAGPCVLDEWERLMNSKEKKKEKDE